MKTIYIVRGSTGAYSDRFDWNVKAFEDKDTAESVATNAEQYVLNALKGPLNRWDEPDVSNNPFDSKCRCHSEYDGISYWVEEVELEVHK